MSVSVVAKFITALLGGAATVVGVGIATHWDVAAVATAAITALTGAIAVFIVPNSTPTVSPPVK